MATLSQLYEAYLQDDPNVEKMKYDPFGWNIEQTFDDQDDDGGGGGGGGEAAGGENYSVLRPDPGTVRLPTGSPYRTDIPNVTDTGEKFSDLPKTDPRYMSEAEQIFQQNRADAGAYAYDSPQYTGGARGNITQTGPGRQFIYDTTGDEYDDIHLYGGPEEDASWFKRLREGVNPLMQALSPFKGAQAIGQMFPVNERAIMEKQGLQQGISLDNIGRVVAQDFGITEDGTYGALNRDDPRNIFAGLNYHLIDQDTIDKMKARINKTIKNKKEDGLDTSVLENRLTIIDQAWANKQLVDETTTDLVDKKTREKGLTPMSDQIALNKAKQDMQQEIKDAENLYTTTGTTVDGGIDAYGLFGADEAPPAGPYAETYLKPVVQEMGTEHYNVTPDAAVKSVMAPDYDTEGMVDEYDELYREFPELLYRDSKQKKKAEADVFKAKVAGGKQDYMNRQKEKATKLAAIEEAKAANEDMQRRIDAYSGPKTYDFDPGQARREGRREDKPRGHTDPGKRSYGPHYSNGGIVDLL